MNESPSEFGTLIADTLTRHRINKETVAAEAGYDVATIYRMVKRSDPPHKGKALAIVAAVNRAAGFKAVDPAEAMTLAGYGPPDVVEAEFLGGPGIERRVARLIDNYVSLPVEVQLDVSAMVQGLRDRRE